MKHYELTRGAAFTLAEVFSPRQKVERRVAFTLAETLITLGIIGVVAAMTLPALITNYKKAQTVNQLKKAYSEISQAVRISEAKYGLLETWDFANFDTPADRVQYFSENYLFPNIKILKRCVPESSSECWPDSAYTLDGKKLSYIVNGSSGRASFITASGYSVYYWLHGSGTGSWFYIDLNGPKKPNTLGKDIFIFAMSWGDGGASISDYDNSKIYKLGFYPCGLQSKSNLTRDDLIDGDIQLGTGSGKNCKKGTGLSNAGAYCSALIMLDGWKIKDDYPW